MSASAARKTQQQDTTSTTLPAYKVIKQTSKKEKKPETNQDYIELIERRHYEHLGDFA